MKRILVPSIALLLVPSAALVVQACSGDDTTDAATHDASGPDSSVAADTGAPDTTVLDTSPGDTSQVDSTTEDAAGREAAVPDAANGGDEDAADAAVEDADDAAIEAAADGSCPAAWTTPPDLSTVDPGRVIAIPADGGVVLLHAAATGTQNYVCVVPVDDAGAILDAGTWVFTGPQADLSDCNGGAIATHFASDAGATRPEWATSDGTFVIAKKVSALTPDAGAIPWLLLQEVSTGGTGTLSHTRFIQRLNTTGGNAPLGACDLTAGDGAVKVPYTADYYFYGTP